MTVDEIKQTYSMREIAERYGVKIKRDGMCSCPFHGKDKHPSMKIYKDSFHCFTCGANGDIFTFIQKTDNCDFKTAFYSLGGSYGDDHKAAQMAKYHAEKSRKNREKKEQERKEREQALLTEMHRYRELYQAQEEGTDLWWEYYDRYHKALLLLGNMEGGGED